MAPVPPHKDPLHGITLEAILIQLVAHHGWPGLGQRIKVRCFNYDPSVKSSLQFLRRTPWARAKVEALYRQYVRQVARPAAKPVSPPVSGLGAGAIPQTSPRRPQSGSPTCS